MRVEVQMEEETKIFENVTKIKELLAFDSFTNKIEIYQGKKKTTLKEYEIIEIEVDHE